VESHRREMVAALERYLAKNRLVTVTGSVLSGRRPKNVNGSVPDLEGVTLMVGQPVFGAAEECDTYAYVDSRARLDALSKVQNAAVFLVVPAECYVPAKSYVQRTFPERNITVLPFGKA